MINKENMGVSATLIMQIQYDTGLNASNKHYYIAQQVFSRRS